MWNFEIGRTLGRMRRTFQVVCGALGLLVAGLAIPQASAVVLPEPVTKQLEQRFEAFVRSDGFSEVDAASLTAEGWYVPSRFPDMGLSVTRPDAEMSPIMKSIMLLESREAALPHARYLVTYRLEAAAPDYHDVRHAYIEVVRFNLGPVIREEVLDAYGAENAGTSEDFGVGPDIAWRFITGSEMGMRASVVRAGRKVLTDAEADARHCFGIPCLARAVVEGPAGDWQPMPRPESDPATHEPDGNLAPRPGQVADDLFAYATRNGEELSEGLSGQPQVTMVVSKNVVGQDRMTSGLLHQGHLMDDAISDIWTRRVEIGGFVEWRKLVVHRPGRQ